MYKLINIKKFLSLPKLPGSPNCGQTKGTKSDMPPASNHHFQQPKGIDQAVGHIPLLELSSDPSPVVPLFDLLDSSCPTFSSDLSDPPVHDVEFKRVLRMTVETLQTLPQKSQMESS